MASRPSTCRRRRCGYGKRSGPPRPHRQEVRTAIMSFRFRKPKIGGTAMRLAVSAALLILSYGIAQADAVGHYAVAGANPGGDGKYSGEVSVTKTGDTYRVVWNVGGDQYIGTGI